MDLYLNTRATASPNTLQNFVYIDLVKLVGNVYLETFGSCAFGVRYTTNLLECAVAALHNDVLSFCEEHDIPVDTVLTANGRGQCGTEVHLYERSLALNDIEPRMTRVKHRRSNRSDERCPGCPSWTPSGSSHWSKMPIETVNASLGIRMVVMQEAEVNRGSSFALAAQIDERMSYEVRWLFGQYPHQVCRRRPATGQ